jgi:hypothetical protein
MMSAQGHVELEFGVFDAEFTGEDPTGGIEGCCTREVACKLLAFTPLNFY